MIVLECLIAVLWYFVYGFLLARVEKHDLILIALVVLDSLEMIVIAVTFSFWRGLQQRSRGSGSGDSVMSRSFPVPIHLEGTTTHAEHCRNVCEEEAAHPIGPTALTLASRARIEVTGDTELQLCSGTATDEEVLHPIRATPPILASRGAH